MTLNCSAVGDPEPVISWRREGGQLPAGRTVVTSGSLTISNLRVEDSGAYACVATSASVSDVTAVAQVQVGEWAVSNSTETKNIQRSFHNDPASKLPLHIVAGEL